VVKWKLFNRLKGTQKKQTDVQTNTEHIVESEQKPMNPETREEPETVPVKEYNETLYSKGSVQKQPAMTPPASKQPLKRTSWENAKTIEQNIDTMGRKQTKLPRTQTQTSNDTDKKVDYLLLKKKVKR
jgi:hypothetical protein